MNYLVVGPESSGTKMVSKFIALSLGLIDDFNQFRDENKKYLK
jgi:hypothetical protein